MLAQIDYEGGLEEAWRDVVTFAPKLLGFFIILLIGFLVAKALSKVVDALLERVGFNGLVERGSLKTAFERSNTDPSDVIGVVVFWMVFLIALQLAFGIWGPNPISDLLDRHHRLPAEHHRRGDHPGDHGGVGPCHHRCPHADAGRGPGRQRIAKVAGIAVLVVGVFAALSSSRSLRPSSTASSTRC